MFRKVLLSTVFLLSFAHSWASENCEQINSPNLSFVDSGLNVIAFENASLSTREGFEIDSDSCLLDNSNRELLADIRRSDERGLRCLSELGRNAGALRADHLEKLALLKAQGIQILCRKSNDTLTSASVSSSLVLPQDFNEWESRAREAWLFHEQFHLLGYSHETGPDYAEACDECCFGNVSVNTSSDSCRRCINRGDKR